MKFFFLILLISGAIFAQSPIKYLNKGQEDVLHKFGNPHKDNWGDDARENGHYWAYYNLPEKNAETTFNFDSYGGVNYIVIKWEVNGDKAGSLWKKYFKEYSKKFGLYEENADTLAKFSSYTSQGDAVVEIHKSINYFKIEVYNSH